MAPFFTRHRERLKGLSLLVMLLTPVALYMTALHQALLGTIFLLGILALNMALVIKVG